MKYIKWWVVYQVFCRNVSLFNFCNKFKKSELLFLLCDIEIKYNSRVVSGFIQTLPVNTMLPPRMTQTLLSVMETDETDTLSSIIHPSSSL